MIVAKVENLILRVAPFIIGPAVFASLIGVFFWVPTDAGLGISQRIFYYHVPCASSSFLAFGLAGVSSALFLFTRKNEWDHAAHAAVSTGMVFATLVLITGSIWARTAWGTWWTWDARLTTFLVLWMVFAAYVLLRGLGSDNDMAPRYAAVLAIVGALNIPLVMFATRLWRTIHPQVIRNPEGGIDDPRMIATLVLSIVSVIGLFGWLWALRTRVLRLGERVELMMEDSYGGGAAL